MNWAKGEEAQKKREEEAVAELRELRPKLAALVERAHPEIMLTLMGYYVGMLVAAYPDPDAQEDILDSFYATVDDSLKHFTQIAEQYGR